MLEGVVDFISYLYDFVVSEGEQIIYLPINVMMTTVPLTDLKLIEDEI